MLKIYKKRLITGLLVLLFVFGMLFILAMINLKRGTEFFGTGLSYETENILVMVLSFIAMLKSIHEIIKVEHEWIKK